MMHISCSIILVYERWFDVVCSHKSFSELKQACPETFDKQQNYNIISNVDAVINTSGQWTIMFGLSQLFEVVGPVVR